MKKILHGDLVEIIHQSTSYDPLLGLVLGVSDIHGRQFFYVRYTQEGYTDNRWINEKFIKRP